MKRFPVKIALGLRLIFVFPRQDYTPGRNIYFNMAKRKLYVLMLGLLVGGIIAGVFVAIVVLIHSSKYKYLLRINKTGKFPCAHSTVSCQFSCFFLRAAYEVWVQSHCCLSCTYHGHRHSAMNPISKMPFFTYSMHS